MKNKRCLRSRKVLFINLLPVQFTAVRKVTKRAIMEEDLEESLLSRAVPQVGINHMKRDKVINK